MFLTRGEYHVQIYIKKTPVYRLKYPYRYYISIYHFTHVNV